MILLTLDLATHTGFAVGDPDKFECLTALDLAAGRRPVKPYSGVQRIGAKNAEIGPFGCEFEDWLGDMIAAHAVSHLVFEAPWVGAQKDENGNPTMKTSQEVARKLMGLAVLTEVTACRRGVAWIREANNSSVRKHFINVGRGDRKTLKRLTIEACRLRGWEPRSDDEADALALYDYAVHCLKEELKT